MDNSHLKRTALSSLTANDINQQQRGGVPSHQKQPPRQMQQQQWQQKQQQLQQQQMQMQQQWEQKQQQMNSKDCKQLIKSFSSHQTTEEDTCRENIQPTRHHSQKLLPSSPPSSSTTSLTHNYNYEINFPPGPIHIQFEPCITHQIGCKVQSVYFGKEETKTHLQKIQVGHVVTTIDGIDVIFLPFKEVMALLDQRISVHKIIGFKITASTAMICPPTPLTPTHSLFTQSKQNTPTTPKNVKFRSPLIPSSLSPSSPLSPQNNEQDVSNYSVTSANHLSVYSLANSVLENYLETSLSPPLHQLSEATLKRESFPTHAASAVTLLPERNHLRSPKEVASLPSPSPPFPLHPAVNFEEKYRQLLQDLTQSYLQLKNYQDRVEVLEDNLREHRLREENEMKKHNQIYLKYLSLEKGMDGLTQLRGEEIADRDAWMSRATAAEKIITEQKVELKNKLTELRNSYESTQPNHCEVISNQSIIRLCQAHHPFRRINTSRIETSCYHEAIVGAAQGNHSETLAPQGFFSQSIVKAKAITEEEDTDSSVQRSFLTEWWGRYGNQLTVTGDRNSYYQLSSDSLSLMKTPTKDRSVFTNNLSAFATQEVSPLTQFFERTFQEIPGVQSLDMHSSHSLHDTDHALSLEILLQQLSIPNGTSPACELLRVEEIGNLRQEIMRLSAENEDQKRMSELREQELIRILKENDELLRARGDNDVLVQEKSNENENLKKRVWELKSELEELVGKHEIEARKHQRILDQKISDLCHQEEVIRRQEVDIQQKFQLLQATNEKVTILQESLKRYEESHILDLHAEEKEKERARREYVEEMALLKGKYEQQVHEVGLREEVLEESLHKIKTEYEEFKRKYEKLEGELMDTIRALNQKDLQYSIIFQQHQEMLREKQELNQVISQYSQQQHLSQIAEDVSGGHHCHEPLVGTPTPSPLSSPTNMIEKSASSLLLIQEKESILLLTEQLDSIMKETERRESEWNSRHRELELLVHEWRLKANTAMTQVISLKEQTLHILREKKIMEHELSQNWDLIHHQRNEIYDLQQIVENLALEAQRTTQDVHRSSLFTLLPIAQGSSPLMRSLLDDQDLHQRCSRDSLGSSQDPLLSWSQIISRINQRRNEEEQKEMMINDASNLELMIIQALNENKEVVCTPHFHHYPHLISQQQSGENKTKRAYFPEKGYHFLIKLLIRVWKKSRGRYPREHQTKGTQLSPSRSISQGTNTKALISALSKSEFNGHDLMQFTSAVTSSPPSPFMLLNSPPSPPRPRGSFDSIFDLLSSSPPPTSILTSSQDWHHSTNLTLTHSATTSRTSIYQNFLSESHALPSDPSRSSFLSTTEGSFENRYHGDNQSRNDDSNPSPLLGEDDDEVNLSEDDDVLSIEEGNGRDRDQVREESDSFYISSSSYSERSDQTPSPLPPKGGDPSPQNK